MREIVSDSIGEVVECKRACKGDSETRNETPLRISSDGVGHVSRATMSSLEQGSTVGGVLTLKLSFVSTALL